MVDIVHHIVVPKADDLISHGLKVFGSFLILFMLFHMLAAIQLNDQLGFG
jgi:hypothetical protein